jgi:hypothetical protein
MWNLEQPAEAMFIAAAFLDLRQSPEASLRRESGFHRVHAILDVRPRHLVEVLAHLLGHLRLEAPTEKD